MTQEEFLAIAKRISPLGGSGADQPIKPEHIRDEGRKAMFLGNAIIFLGLGLFIAWGLIAPLAEGVPAQGTVVVESLRRTVTHSTGGTIEAVHVKENQFVKAGDVMITLKSERVRTAYDTLMQEYIASAAKLARLRAEEENATSIEFPEELFALAEENGRLETLSAQQDLFLIRRQTLTSELSILQSNIRASGAQADGLRHQAAAKSAQLASLKKEAESMAPLVESGYASRNSYADLERRISELISMKADLETRIAREASATAELRLRLLQRRQEFLRDVETQSAETRNDTVKLQGQLSDAKGDVRSRQIKAPVSGQVVSLLANTPDAAINAGTKIMEIVPENEALLIDVHIPIQTIQSVKIGEKADVRITAFPGEPQLVVEGLVQSVSSDVRPAEPPAQPYYLGRIQITPEGMQELGQRQLRPGMSVDVVIKTGERSLLAYLMRPLLKQLFFALKEQ